MKLQFSNKADIAALEIQGSVDLHDLSVLKAGITKLFAGNKKKIVLSLSQSEIGGESVLKELPSLGALARSHDAALVFSGLGTDLKSKLAGYAGDSPLSIFSTDEEAYLFLQKSSDDPGDSHEVIASLKRNLDAKDKEIAALKARVSQGDPEEAIKARVEMADLVAKNRYLEEQVRNMLLDRRLPPDPAAVAEKINILESTINAMMKKMEGKEAKK